MKKIFLIVLCLGLVAGITKCWAEEAPKGKIAIVLQTGNETHEGFPRVVHALLYARQLAESGYEVALIYDGAGTIWASELAKPDSPLHGHYAKFKESGLVEVIDDYDAAHAKVKESLPESQKKLLASDFEGHVDLAKWINKGYQIIVI